MRVQLLLQLLGGGCYLLNKVFLSFSERTSACEDGRTSRRWRIASWGIYIFGLPPWVIIFLENRNWIAALVEASGAPAMMLGLVLAIKGQRHKPPRWLDLLAIACAAAGFSYSLWDNRGLTTLSQWLEIGLVSGYLVGTYQLAKERSAGYFWFILMHVSCGTLVWMQKYPWLCLQQVVSMGFIVDAYLSKTRQQRKRAGGTR